jgi:hypothetical protein
MTTTSPSIPSSEHVPPLSARREHPLSQDQQTRVQEIINAAKRRDWNVLAALAASPGGFIDDDVRRIVCMCEKQFSTAPLAPSSYWNSDKIAGPLVLGGDNAARPSSSGISWRELPEHREEGQVELDVNRSFVYYPTGKRTIVLWQMRRSRRYSPSTNN